MATKVKMKNNKVYETKRAAKKQLDKAKNNKPKKRNNAPTPEEAAIRVAKLQAYCTVAQTVGQIVVGITGCVGAAYGIKATMLELDLMKQKRENINAMENQLYNNTMQETVFIPEKVENI